LDKHVFGWGLFYSFIFQKMISAFIPILLVIGAIILAFLTFLAIVFGGETEK